MPTGKLKNAGESQMAAVVREAIGAGPNEEVEVTTPQFTREPGAVDPSAPPASREDWGDLSNSDRNTLRERGLRCWGGFRRSDRHLSGWGEAVGEDATHEVWLFPGEWYNSIPAGLEIAGLSGELEAFVSGHTDDDIRFGCLPYGVMIKVMD